MHFEKIDCNYFNKKQTNPSNSHNLIIHKNFFRPLAVIEAKINSRVRNISSHPLYVRIKEKSRIITSINSKAQILLIKYLEKNEPLSSFIKT